MTDGGVRGSVPVFLVNIYLVNKAILKWRFVGGPMMARHYKLAG